jgi:hypothetical protein
MKRIGLLATLVFLAAAVTAMAAPTMTYRGKTDQGRKAYVKVKDGDVTAVNVPWVFKKSNCTPQDGYSLGNGKPYVYVSTESKPIVRKGNRFTAGRHEVFKVGAHGKATIDGKLSGKFSGKQVTGKSVMSAKSNDSFGRHTCKRTIHFSVKLSG